MPLDPDTVHLVYLAVYWPKDAPYTEYQSFCNCGRYRSTWRFSPGMAERDGVAHITGKGGNGEVTGKRYDVSTKQYDIEPR